MPTDKFWELANGNPCFTAWLNRVDRLCLRFLDMELLSIPEALEDPYYPDTNFEDNVSPEAYLLLLLHSMKQSSPVDDIDQHVARMVMWGSNWPPTLT